MKRTCASDWGVIIIAAVGRFHVFASGVSGYKEAAAVFLVVIEDFS